MFEKIKTSYNLVKVSLQFIKRDWELLTYSIFSLLASVAIFATFAWTGFFFIDEIEGIEASEGMTDILIYAGVFVYYLVFSFITFFFNTAIITSVQRRINWEDNKLWDGLRDAMKHLKEIFIWSLINATITTILKILQNKFGENSLIWKFVIWIVGWMWNILTFFSFPLMIINKVWPKDAIKESWMLFKKTWWERAIIHVWVGFIFSLLFILVIIISVFLMFSGIIELWIWFLILSTLSLIILSSTCDVIIKTILLSYAQTWKLPDWLENEESIINITKTKEL